MSIKILDDLVQENGTPEQIKAYKKCNKILDNAPASASFIITSPEIAKVLNEVLHKKQKND